MNGLTDEQMDACTHTERGRQTEGERREKDKQTDGRRERERGRERVNNP